MAKRTASHSIRTPSAKGSGVGIPITHRLIAVLSVYQEAFHIANTLKTLDGYADEIHVFDGAYPPFPHDTKKPGSTDKTKDIVNAFPNTIWHPAESYRDQTHKRTRTLQIGKPGDYLIVVDGDERVFGLENLPLGDYDVGWVCNYSPLYDKPYRSPRVFRWRDGLHYAGRHSWIYDQEKKLFASHQHLTLHYQHLDLPVSIWNLRDWNGSSRESQKRHFRRGRNPVENSFKSENSVYKTRAKLVPHAQRAGRTSSCTWEIISQTEVHPKYTMICPFSRVWAIERWFDRFRELDFPKEETELLVIVDHNQNKFRDAVREEIKKSSSSLATAKLLFTGEAPPPERSKAHERRSRIIGNLRRFLCEARGEILLGAEDDTIPDVDAYPKLIEHLVKNPEVGFVQGTEVGRWSMPLIPHWSLGADYQGNLNEVSSGSYTGQDLVEIQGGGWYLFATYTDIFRAVDLNWENPVGPDVWCIWRICQMGWKCLGDWSINAEHFTQNYCLHPADGGLRFRHYTRTSDGGWKLRQGSAKHRIIPDRLASMVLPPKKKKVPQQKLRTLQRKHPPKERIVVLQNGDHPMRKTIAVCLPRRNVKIGSLLHSPPPLGGYFEMIDLVRARTLEKQGKIKIVRLEDYYGPDFQHSRILTTEHRTPPKNVVLPPEEEILWRDAPKPG